MRGDEVRSRGVLWEFANRPGMGEFFAPTPSPTATSLLHYHSAKEGLPIIYIDATAAVLHAPESDVI